MTKVLENQLDSKKEYLYLETILATVLRTIAGYFLLLTLARLLGRKVISQMTFFDFLVGVTIGPVTATLAIGLKRSPLDALIVLITLVILTIIVDYAHIKSLWARKLLNSEPVVLIANGQIVKQNMRKLRLTINDLNMLLREKNIFNPVDVEFALLEADGKLSVLPKSQKQPLTPSDLNLPTTYKGLTKDLIIDGKIMGENLQDIHLDEQRLKKQLEAQGIDSVGDVFYVGLDTSGNLYVSKRDISKEKHGQYGIE